MEIRSKAFPESIKHRLERPWILFPYKFLKSEIALTLKVLLLWLSNYRKLLILGCSFMWCKLFTLSTFVYDKNKDTPLWIGSMGSYMKAIVYRLPFCQLFSPSCIRFVVQFYHLHFQTMGNLTSTYPIYIYIHLYSLCHVSIYIL